MLEVILDIGGGCRFISMSDICFCLVFRFVEEGSSQVSKLSCLCFEIFRLCMFNVVYWLNELTFLDDNIKKKTERCRFNFFLGATVKELRY